MHMFHRLGAGAALGTLMCAGSALAAAPGFYLGGSYGQTTVEQEVGPFDFDETDDSWKLFGGARFGLLGIEGSYVNLVDASDANVDLEVTGWDLFGTLNFGTGPFTFFGKAGGIAWESTVDVGTLSADDDGTDLAYGAGVAFDITPATAIRGEWERFEIGDLDEVDMMSLGLQFTF